MPLNAVTLGSAFRTVFLANGAADNPATAKLCLELAQAMVAHIQANAVVTGTATGAVAGGPGVPVVGTIQ